MSLSTQPKSQRYKSDDETKDDGEEEEVVGHGLRHWGDPFYEFVGRAARLYSLVGYTGWGNHSHRPRRLPLWKTPEYGYDLASRRFNSGPHWLGG